MGFTLCREDPLVKEIRRKYGANVVRAPRRGIDPLDVLARIGDRVEMRGDLASILEGSEPLSLPPVSSAVAAEISGKVSSEVEVGLGAELTAKFLAELGVPVPGAEIAASLWDGATSFSFQVKDVREVSVDINRLGTALQNRALSADSPATAIFFPEVAPARFTDVDVLNSATMHIITRTLTSSHIVLRATAAAGVGLDVKVDAIKDLIGEANAKVAWKRESQGVVSFRGTRAVTFAFATIPCNLRPDRTFTLGLETRDVELNDDNAETGPETFTRVKHFPLIDADGLLEVQT